MHVTDETQRPGASPPRFGASRQDAADTPRKPPGGSWSREEASRGRLRRGRRAPSSVRADLLRWPERRGLRGAAPAACALASRVVAFRGLQLVNLGDRRSPARTGYVNGTAGPDEGHAPCTGSRAWTSSKGSQRSGLEQLVDHHCNGPRRFWFVFGENDRDVVTRSRVWLGMGPGPHPSRRFFSGRSQSSSVSGKPSCLAGASATLRSKRMTPFSSV